MSIPADPVPREPEASSTNSSEVKHDHPSPPVSNVTCHTCLQKGHISRFCTVPRLRPTQSRCFVCGGFGHQAKLCPVGNEGKNSEPRCYACLEKGHIAKDCNVPRKRPDQIFASRRKLNVTCFRCGQAGHVSPNCMN